MPNHNYFMGFAHHAATASKDKETQVGAALVTPKGRVCMTGYNGPPIGVNDTPERLCRPSKYPWMSHAEQNVIAFAANEGVKAEGCTLYVTHAPCSNCARSIIQAGITCVAVGDGKTTMPDDERDIVSTLFSEAGVEIIVGFSTPSEPVVRLASYARRWSEDKPETPAIPEGWIPWSGGDCPVARGTRGEVLLRNGKMHDTDNLDCAFWDHGFGGGDIIAYKVEKPADFKLKAGRFYITATGERVGPTEKVERPFGFVFQAGATRTWTRYGEPLGQKHSGIVALAADQTTPV